MQPAVHISLMYYQTGLRVFDMGYLLRGEWLPKVSLMLQAEQDKTQ